MSAGAAAATSVVWLRHDLRLADNPALTAAAERGGPVVVLFVLDDDPAVARPRGGASRWWLHGSLASLDADLRALGSRLVLRRGSAAAEVPAVVAETGAGAVFWNRRYGEGERNQDAALKESLRASGLEVRSFQASLLFEPWHVRRSDGEPFGVYSAYARAVGALDAPRAPLPAPASLAAPVPLPESDELDDWGLLPTKPDWAGGLRATWTPGERGGRDRLDAIVERLDRYGEERDRAGADSTSRLSPYLRTGEVSPFQIWHRVTEADPEGQVSGKYRGEVLWREFNYTLLFAHPRMAEENLRPAFDRFPWRTPDPEVLRRWQRGRTGFPLVDAGMRQLWETGWMHNRVRMVAASFLIKNLLIDWREGERWFWDTLVDADPANNAASWQWVAGSGIDPAPFFRVFNPVLQSRKFDPEGVYLRRWLPELRDLDDASIHEPRGVPGYPEAMVDLKASRAEALRAFDSISV
ncbi:deoxyribodipyrimidine photo-lyase [Naasia sp. SYSU D00948]|uniref:cryptochrome/photolyase family protein n=1 Tax=Naasia sp. SYSU D00948 TaxID=2817379 RepID=UPI001B301D49|nr:deoxyribodipyrimidine photo-lyase [Naasia sp. SYSU D00948]